MCITCKGQVPSIVENLAVLNTVGTCPLDAVMVTPWTCRGDGRPTKRPFRNLARRAMNRPPNYNLLFQNWLGAPKKISWKSRVEMGLVEFADDAVHVGIDGGWDVSRELEIHYTLEDCLHSCEPIRKAKKAKGVETIKTEYEYIAINPNDPPPSSGKNRSTLEVVVDDG